MVKIRCCIKCKTRKPKEELFRIVSDDNKMAILDEKQKINKRAIYICKNKKCMEEYIKFIKKKKVNLRPDISLDSLLELLESLVVGMGE